MPCMGDNFTLSAHPKRPGDNSELRRSYITHCEWHKAEATNYHQLPSHCYDVHSHNEQRHLFSNSTKNTENNLVLSELSTTINGLSEIL